MQDLVQCHMLTSLEACIISISIAGMTEVRVLCSIRVILVLLFMIVIRKDCRMTALNKNLVLRMVELY